MNDYQDQRRRQPYVGQGEDEYVQSVLACEREARLEKLREGATERQRQAIDAALPDDPFEGLGEPKRITR